MNSMHGLLHQLSSLSLIAAELFDSVFDTAKKTSDRIQSIRTRVDRIKATLPQMEDHLFSEHCEQDLLLSSAAHSMSDEATRVIHRRDQQNISQANLPTALRWQYTSNCIPNPTFDPLLEAMHPRNKCLTDYTNPGFFFEAWAKAELARQEQRKKERREKRARARALREATGDGGQLVAAKKKEVKKISLNRNRYNKEGELIVGTQITSAPSATSMKQHSAATPMSASPPPPPPPSSYEQQQYQHHQQQQSPTLSGIAPPPPPPPPPGAPGSPGMMVSSPPMSIASPPAYSPPPLSPGLAPSMPAGGAAPPPPPPPPPPAAGVPPPPPPPVSMGAPSAVAVPQSSSGGSASITDLISAGVQLKKAEVNTRPAAPLSGTSGLLEQIRQGAPLKSAAERKLPEPVQVKSQEMDVASVLAQKFANVFDDDSDYDDDDDSWDD